MKMEGNNCEFAYIESLRGEEISPPPPPPPPLFPSPVKWIEIAYMNIREWK